MKRYLAPSEVAKTTIKNAITKSELSITRMVLLGLLAGIYIGFGGYGSIIITQTLGNIDIGFAKFMGAVVFPVGLMLVVIAGGELFTGNNLMTMAVLDKKITFPSMLRNWFFVYFANFLGSIILAYSIFNAELIFRESLDTVLDIGILKMSFTFSVAVLRAILCNIIVVLAVWLGAAAQDIVSRILATWFPIMLFVLSGFEHSVANMFFLSLAKFYGLGVTWSEIWLQNLIPVTIGNIIGGAIIIPVIYYVTYILPAKENYN